MTKTQIVILWGLAVLVVGVFVVLSQVVVRRPVEAAVQVTQPVQVRQMPDIAQSAKKFYLRADQAARTWQGDAQLVSTTASWPFARVGDLSVPVEWTFQFFSPGTQVIYVVNVSESAATKIVETFSPYEVQTIDIDRWQIDSPQALGAWLSYGGEDFLNQHSVVDVSARLRFAEDGRLIWSMVGVVRGSQTLHLVKVDAESGEVVP